MTLFQPSAYVQRKPLSSPTAKATAGKLAAGGRFLLLAISGTESRRAVRLALASMLTGRRWGESLVGLLWAKNPQPSRISARPDCQFIYAASSPVVDTAMGTVGVPSGVALAFCPDKAAGWLEPVSTVGINLPPEATLAAIHFAAQVATTTSTETSPAISGERPANASHKGLGNRAKWRGDLGRQFTLGAWRNAKTQAGQTQRGLRAEYAASADRANNTQNAGSNPAALTLSQYICVNEKDQSYGTGTTYKTRACAEVGSVSRLNQTAPASNLWELNSRGAAGAFPFSRAASSNPFPQRSSLHTGDWTNSAVLAARDSFNR